MDALLCGSLRDWLKLLPATTSQNLQSNIESRSTFIAMCILLIYILCNKRDEFESCFQK